MSYESAQHDEDLALMRRAVENPFGPGFEGSPQAVARMLLVIERRLSRLEGDHLAPKTSGQTASIGPGQAGGGGGGGYTRSDTTWSGAGGGGGGK